MTDTIYTRILEGSHRRLYRHRPHMFAYCKRRNDCCSIYTKIYMYIYHITYHTVSEPPDRPRRPGCAWGRAFHRFVGHPTEWDRYSFLLRAESVTTARATDNDRFIQASRDGSPLHRSADHCFGRWHHYDRLSHASYDSGAQFAILNDRIVRHTAGRVSRRQTEALPTRLRRECLSIGIFFFESDVRVPRDHLAGRIGAGVMSLK